MVQSIIIFSLLQDGCKLVFSGLSYCLESLCGYGKEQDTVPDHINGGTADEILSPKQRPQAMVMTTGFGL